MITYRVICCLDCHGFTGKIADLARDLKKELRWIRYDRFTAAMAAAPFGKPFAH